MEPRGRSPGLLGRRTPAWRPSALWVSTRPAFVRWYSRARPTPGSGRLDAREERSMPVVQHGRVFTPGPAPGNPYTIQLERYYKPFLSVPATSGNGEQEQASERLGARPACVETQRARPSHPARARGFSSLDKSQGLSSQVSCKPREVESGARYAK